jgi:hypothetical protein
MNEKMMLGVKPKNTEKFIGSMESKNGRLTFWLVKNKKNEFAIIAKDEAGKIVKSVNYED